MMTLVLTTNAMHFLWLPAPKLFREMEYVPDGWSNVLSSIKP